MIVPGVICKKENAKVLELTINSQLVEALSEIEDGKLEMTPTVPGKVKCTIIPQAQTTQNVAVWINLYVVSVLIFYGTILTVCLGSKNIIFLYFDVYVTSGVSLKGVAESSLLSKDEPLTPKIDEVMAV